MITTAADVAGIRGVWHGRRGFMASGVAVRFKLHVRNFLQANRAGNLQ